jgi:Uncharacterized protein conserved in bacteria (DUF2188)
MAKITKTKKLTEQFSRAAAASDGRVHVVFTQGSWSVKKEGSKRAYAVKPTKESAVKTASGMKSTNRVIIHKKDGTIQKNTAKR